MGELTTINHNLPANIEDLSKFVLVGREKLAAVRAEIRAIDKVGLAREVREQKLREGQEIAEAVLDAEVRIGALMATVPKATPNNNPSGKRKTQIDTSIDLGTTKAEVITNAGFTQKQVEHFQQMAAHPEAVARAKAQARDKGDILSRSKVLQEVGKDIRAARKAERIEKSSSGGASIDIFNAGKKYRVIYADPPWSYNDKQDTDYYGGAVKHYPTMELEDICAIPVPAEKNAVLFLWTTSPMLEDSFKVINAWGFKYKSSFIWDKVSHSMGHYNSVRHEFLLIATRGSCTPDVPRLLDSVVSIKRTEHSRKPKEFRDMIDMLYPAGERLEMFAREAHEGWDVWGNMA